MAVKNSLTAAVKDFKKEVEDNMTPAMKQVSIDFYRLSSERGVTPVKSGTLRRSAMISSEFEQGIVRWTTPYAMRRNVEGSITGITYWDVVTWDRNKEQLVKNYLRYLYKGD